MKNIHLNIKMLAALLMAGAAFTACSSSDDIAVEQPVNPAQKSYTMTVNATKGGSAQTRALSLSENTLNATWATTENVYVKKGSDWAGGTLQPQADGASATLKGTLSGVTINAGDALTLQFPKSGAISYSGQKGTIADIAANFDYATANVTVSSVTNGKITTNNHANFANQQAIIKFSLTDKTTSTAINPSALTITDGVSTVSLTSIPNATYSTNGAGVLYVAFPAAGAAKTITLTATVGSDTYTYEKSGATFTNGKYYAIGVKMKKQLTYPIALANVTNYYIGSVVTTDGYVYATTTTASKADKTAAAMIAFVGSTSYCDHGLAIALEDESSSMKWSVACGATSGAAVHTPTVQNLSWKLPSDQEWNKMLTYINTNYYCDNLNESLVAAGGKALQTANHYWYKSSNDDEKYTYLKIENYDSKLKVTKLYNADDSENKYVRACLAF